MNTIGSNNERNELRQGIWYVVFTSKLYNCFKFWKKSAVNPSTVLMSIGFAIRVCFPPFSEITTKTRRDIATCSLVTMHFALPEVLPLQTLSEQWLWLRSA
ncbi:hypothetical protein AVEN_271521-1 [Araneus ventricosus]|uniref:Uncharacterized protein n=1 Tax=Araneus ventricosus TaxID=182803 RepID=A0A4Y2FYF9_ARAVE|nr:hypothetical protein AVEN_271521-1 [Araneus ventricosus]